MAVELHIYLPPPSLAPQAETFFWKAYRMEREAGSECVEIVSRRIFFPYSYTAGTRIWGPHDATRVAIAWAEQECMIEL